MKIYSEYKRMLLYAVVWLPAFSVFVLIFLYGQNVPFLDDWYTPGFFFRNIFHNGFSFHALFSQHNEGRFVFPKLLWYITYPIIGWQVKFQMFFSWILAVGVSIGIFRLIRNLFFDRIKIVFCLTFISNFLLFSTIQYENWLWGMQWITFIPILSLLGIIYINNRVYASLSARILISSTLSFIAMFSFPNGMAVWFASYLLIFKENFFPYKNKYWYIWIVSCGLSFLIYFYEYVRPGELPSITETIQHPVALANYFITVIGGPLTKMSHNILTPIIGSLTLVLFLGVSAFLLIKNKFQNYYLIAFMVIGIFSLLSIAQISLGRALIVDGFNPNASRYYGQTILLYISTIALITYSVFNNEFFKRGIVQKFFKIVVFVVGVGIMISATFGYVRGYSIAKNWWYKNVQKTHVCTSLISSGMIDSCIIVGGVMKADVFLKVKEFVTNKNVFKPIEVYNDPQFTSQSGWIDNYSIESEILKIDGWAANPVTLKPLDFVFVKIEYSDGTSSSTFDSVEIPRPDVSKYFSVSDKKNYGWNSSLPIKNTNFKITALGIDADTLIAYPLNLNSKYK